MATYNTVYNLSQNCWEFRCSVLHYWTYWIPVFEQYYLSSLFPNCMQKSVTSALFSCDVGLKKPDLYWCPVFNFSDCTLKNKNWNKIKCVTSLSSVLCYIFVKMKSCAKRDPKSENVKLIKPLQIVQSNDLTIGCNMSNTFLTFLWMLG